MQFKALVISYEPNTFTTKGGTVIKEDVFTCLDGDAKTKMKDTVDVVVREGLVQNPAGVAGKTVTFSVNGLGMPRGRSTRMQMMAAGVEAGA